MSESAVLERLRQGDHVCWAFHDEDTRDRLVTRYVVDGIRAGHRVLCSADRAVLDRAATLLGAEGGIDVAALVDRGALELRTPAETYLAGGVFRPDDVIGLWGEACRAARAAGFTGLRVLGDAAWAAAGTVPGSDLLGAYEARVNEVFAEGYAMALCLYDRRAFPPDQLAECLAAHPGAVDTRDGDAPEGGWDPLLRMSWLPRHEGLRLVGEIDLSNRGAAHALLAGLHARPGAERPVLDVRDLRFVDAPTAALLAQLVAAPDGPRLVGASRSLERLLAVIDGRAVLW